MSFLFEKSLNLYVHKVQKLGYADINNENIGASFPQWIYKDVELEYTLRLFQNNPRLAFPRSSEISKFDETGQLKIDQWIIRFWSQKIFSKIWYLNICFYKALFHLIF